MSVRPNLPLRLLCASWLALGAFSSDLACPDGSVQVGVINAAVSTSIAQRMDLSTIEQCAAECDANTACKAYSWAPMNGNDNFLESTACVLSASIIPDTTQGSNTILCRPECELAFTTETSAYLSGDPHFTLWNGITHHFQGPGTVAAYESYYLIAGCDTNDYESVPWRLSGTFYPTFGNRMNPTATHYITLEMFDGDSTYLMWIGGRWTMRSKTWVAEVPRGTSHQYQDVQNMDGIVFENYLANQGWTSPSGKFVVETTGAGSNEVWVTLTVKQPIDDGSTVDCTQTFYTYGSYVRADPPSCYKCDICGLFGDFQTPLKTASMRACDGSDVSFPTYFWDAGDEIYAEDGWSWKVDNVYNQCAGHIDAITEPAEETCSDAVLTAATAQCAQAVLTHEVCCAKIGGDFCTHLQEDCEEDVCVTAGDDVGLVEETVQEVFSDIVQAQCLTVSFPAPTLLYEFNGNLEETISDGDSAYTLSTTGNAVVEHGVLVCDGAGGTAFSPEIDLSLQSHTMEILMKLANVEDGGTLMSIETMENNLVTEWEALAYNAKKNNDKKQVTVASGKATDTEESYWAEQAKWVEETDGEVIISVTATFDTDANQVVFYRNGEKVLDYNPDFLVTHTAGDDDQWIVEFCAQVDDTKGLKQDFHGSILYGAFYETALTADEVKSMYLSKMPNWLYENSVEVIGDVIEPGRSINKGQALMSANGLFAAVVNNGNFYIKKSADTTTYVKDYGFTTVEYVTYELDGSLMAYDSNGNPTEIFGADANAAFLVMAGDGMLQAFTTLLDDPYYDSSVAATAAQAVVEMPMEGEYPVNYVKPVEYSPPADPAGSFGASAVEDVTSSTVQNMLFLTMFLLTLNAACLGWNYYKKKDNRGVYKTVIAGSMTEVDTDTETDMDV